MSEKTFWRTTPVRLSALAKIHSDIINPSSEPKVAQTVEDIPFLI